MAPLAYSMEGVVTISLLGPILEETLLRGCLLPLIARTVGNTSAIIASACIFAAFHAPTDIAQGVFFAIGGIVYGWIRAASATTTAPAFAHAVCNPVLLLSASY
jgi:membrane protease YdiL (CAAX protease family)